MTDTDQAQRIADVILCEAEHRLAERNTKPESKFTAEDWQQAVTERRRAVMPIGPDILAHILELPDGVRVRGVAHNWLTDSVEVLVEGPTLAPVVEGCEPPRLMPAWAYDGEGQRLRYVPWTGQPEGTR